MRRGLTGPMVALALMAQVPTDVPRLDDRPTHAAPPIPPEALPGRRIKPPVETNPEGRGARRRRARGSKPRG